MSNRLVIYHNNCFDGFGAAWAAQRYWPDAAFHAADYGSDPPDIRGKDVIVADFSYTRNGSAIPAELMDRLDAAANTFRVFDHHKTAQEALAGKPYATFDMNRSGAMITWQSLFPNEKVPVLLTYVQDRDLWHWKLPFSREVNAWIASHAKEFDVWSRLAYDVEQSFDQTVLEGAAILRFQTVKVNEICRQATLQTVGTDQKWWMVPVVNSPVFQSEVGEQLLENYPNHAFSAYYFDRADGFRQWGLRGRAEDDFDVSEVAKMFGGGGHKKAAGFQEKLT